MLQRWAYGKRIYWDDFVADQETQMFLKRCEHDGRLTKDEFVSLSLGKTTTGRSRPERLVRYADFVQAICDDIQWPEADVRRCLALHLETENILSQHIEFYLNYPAWTIPELAELFDTTSAAVSIGLQRVRKTWPTLRLDGTKAYGVPHLAKMLGFHARNRGDGTEYNRLDCSEIIPICGRFSTEGLGDENDSTDK